MKLAIPRMNHQEFYFCTLYLKAGSFIPGVLWVKVFRTYVWFSRPMFAKLASLMASTWGVSTLISQEISDTEISVCTFSSTSFSEEFCEMSLAFTISQGPKSLPLSSVSSTVPISQSIAGQIYSGFPN